MTGIRRRETGIRGFARRSRALFKARRVAATKHLIPDSRHPAPERGFTLFELIVVIVIIVTIMALFLDRAQFYQEQAEKTAMESVAGSIQSSLTLQYSQVMTRGKPSDVAALELDNPMSWLQQKPRNYAGEFYDIGAATVEPGNWAFDLKARQLVYLPRNNNHFIPGADGRKWIRFHVVTVYQPSRLPSLKNQPRELTGIVFEPVESFSWFR